MASTFDQVRAILADQCDLAPSQITPESHILDDLRIDSLDFLDSVYALDKHFGVKVPVETFADDEHWQVKSLVEMIDQALTPK